MQPAQSCRDVVHLTIRPGVLITSRPGKETSSSQRSGPLQTFSLEWPGALQPGLVLLMVVGLEIDGIRIFETLTWY